MFKNILSDDFEAYGILAVLTVFMVVLAILSIPYAIFTFAMVWIAYLVGQDWNW